MCNGMRELMTAMLKSFFNFSFIECSEIFSFLYICHRLLEEHTNHGLIKEEKQRDKQRKGTKN